MDEEELLFPFVDIVGQNDMKRALMLNMIDPRIGGVLIRGDKGTAKSTTVRSLVNIMPSTMSSKGCRFHCSVGSTRDMCPRCRELYERGELMVESRRMTVVELPLNATEDRIAGSLDIENMLTTGERRFESGVLAQANGNLLYIDEVNLLDDHIVDLLLDAAAMGRNYVEREGISFTHPARFILVGTMNPEEGNLRPQLLDRFGMCVDISGDADPDVRMDVIKRRLSFDSDPEAYMESCRERTDELRERIDNARRIIGEVTVSDRIIHTVAVLAIRFGMEGHRADIAMIRAAKANAALEGRVDVEIGDIRSTAGLVLRHRLNGGPFEERAFNQDELDGFLRSYSS